MNLEHKIEEIMADVIDIRRHLHEYPELSECEIETSAYISSVLSTLSIPHITNIAGYGIIATIEGTKKTKTPNNIYQTVAIRADMDALPITEETHLSYASKKPGIMHGCGHDVHTAILLGAARVLKEIEDTFSGTVKLFFQPAEETIGGANQMIQAGCLENPQVEAVIGLHIQPKLPTGHLEFYVGEMNAASTEMEIKIQGSSCHGAHPNDGIDSILIASHVIVALQSIGSRNLDPTTPSVVTVGQIHGGTKNNIIPTHTTFSGIIRTMDNETREFVKNRVIELATNTAAAYGGKAEITLNDSYPALTNDIPLTKKLMDVATECISKDKITVAKKPSLGAEDFSYFTQALPGVYFNLGTTSKDETKPQALHSEHLLVDENAMYTGILMEVKSVLAMLK